ncbi:alpha-N-arabinofuranosidase [Cellulomonas marina]|uniref:non-reducing end alpha-L-arabinofuranosidase n=1 Tax=Cellulomonas marina TaxID=988821 RepID=A0A1I0WV01_9CELL|nr:alpha-L-arabinofuranosidase C-terminal domain-containing protein [Cellulomonas marina]GIG30363.1 alpha-N-arabinofuranosidase [Cellulomonas marina]SFA92471.1 alpha-N-arabinofuranosidase [Cellulomonas marina]
MTSTTTTPVPTDGDAAPVALRAVVDLDVAGPTISRHLYGHFAEHLGRCIYGGFWVGEDADVPHEGGIRLDVVEALRALDIPNLRWPGGCFADEYHWEDGIGPRDERPRMVNTHWGDVVENNHFGTHEFMALCELLGTEPYVSANVGSGSVQEMSDWVEYLTRGDDSPMARRRRENGRDEPWRVQFWGIGNEPWGCGGNLRAPQFASLARQYSTYARNHGDNRLYRIAAGASDADYAWTETLVQQVTTGLGDRTPSDLFQAVSFHYYTIAGDWGQKGSATTFTDDEYWTTVRKALHVRELLAGHAAVLDAYDPTKKIGLALDEWGTWWDVEPGTNPGFLYQQNTMRDALVAGLHFDAFHDFADRLRLANIAQTVNVLQAMLLTDGEALVRTPTYHVFEMNKGHHDATALPVHAVGERTRHAADVGEVDTVSVSASTKDGHVLVSLTHLDPTTSARVELSLRGASVGAPQARVLAADDVAAHNTAEAPDAVAPRALDGVRVQDGVLVVELPPASFATVRLPLV